MDIQDMAETRMDLKNEFMELKKQWDYNHAIIKDLQSTAAPVNEFILKQKLKQSNLLLDQYQSTLEQIMIRFRSFHLEWSQQQSRLQQQVARKVKGWEDEVLEVKNENIALKFGLQRLMEGINKTIWNIDWLFLQFW